MSGKRPTDKLKIGKVREEYAHKYAGKLREKDEIIQNLLAKLKELEEHAAGHQAELDKKDAEIASLQSLVQELREKAGMSPDDLALLRHDIERRKSVYEAISGLAAMGNAFRGIYKKT